MGVKGVHPLGCLPLWEREGVTLTNSMSYHWNEFTKAKKEIHFFLGKTLTLPGASPCRCGASLAITLFISGIGRSGNKRRIARAPDLLEAA